MWLKWEEKEKEKEKEKETATDDNVPNTLTSIQDDKTNFIVRGAINHVHDSVSTISAAPTTAPEQKVTNFQVGYFSWALVNELCKVVRDMTATVRRDCRLGEFIQNLAKQFDILLFEQRQRCCVCVLVQDVVWDHDHFRNWLLCSSAFQRCVLKERIAECAL